MSGTKDPYEYTATGVLGEQRDTMLHNELHLRNELGRVSCRGYVDYPGEKWRYGLPYPPSTGGVAEALSHWNTGLPKIGSKVKVEKERDFMALNKEAAKSGVVTANEQYQYRATHDIRRKSLIIRDNTVPKVRKLPASMVFGISTRPCTPIHDLLEHKFQGKWINDMKAAQLAQKQQIAQARAKSIKQTKAQSTRGCQLRQYQVPVASAPLWKMPRFSKNAQPALSTFRTDGEKSAAFKHNTHDRIGRNGVEGAGVYMSAVY